MRRKFLCVVLVLAMVGSIASVVYAQAPAPAKVYNWRLQSTHPAGHDANELLCKRIAKNLDAFSNGRIKLTIFASGALVPLSETLNMLGKGVFEMAFSYAGYWAGIMPVANLECGFPGSWRTAGEQAAMFYDKGIIEILTKAYAEQGVRYLVNWSAAAEGYSIESKVKFKNLNDLKKLKVRAVGPNAMFLNNLGIQTVNVPYPEAYMALKLGTIDACAFGLRSWITAKLYEVTKYLLMPTITIPHGNILMNIKLWNELPPDIKMIVNYATMEAVWYMFRRDDNEVELMYKSLEKELGCELITLPPNDQAEMVKAQQKLWVDLVKDDYCKQFMKIVEDYARYKGHIK